MSDFGLWFSTGLEHILDLEGYDHILFVSLLVLTYPLKQWKRLLVLVTAFTVGHSLSMALSVINQLYLRVPLIEFLIAATILATGVFNLINYKKEDPGRAPLIYFTILFFGMVHGLGFSFLLRSMLGAEQNVILPLLYFNLGLEAGQIVIIGIVSGFSLLLAHLFKWPYRTYKLVFICVITLIALKICAERLPELFQAA